MGSGVGWLESLREAGEKATPGPWTRGGNVITNQRDIIALESPEKMRYVVATLRAGSDHDAELILAARNCWGPLLEVAEKATDIASYSPRQHDGYYRVSQEEMDALVSALLAARVAVGAAKKEEEHEA